MDPLLTLLKRPRMAEGDFAAKTGVPPSALPAWMSLPLDAKLPMLRGPKGAIVLCSTKLCEPLHVYDTARDFDLTDPYAYTMSNLYKTLHDKHLRHHFARKPLRRRLIRNGFLTRDGRVLCTLAEFNEYRQYLRKLHLESVAHERRRREEQEKRRKALLEEQKNQEKDVEGMSLARLREEKAKQVREKLRQEHEAARSRYMQVLVKDNVHRQELRKVALNSKISAGTAERDLKRDQIRMQRRKEEKRKKLAFMKKWIDEDQARARMQEEKQYDAKTEQERKLDALWEERKMLQEQRLQEEEQLREQAEIQRRKNIEYRERHVAAQRRKHQAALQRMAEKRAKHTEEIKMKYAHLWGTKVEDQQEGNAIGPKAELSPASESLGAKKSKAKAFDMSSVVGNAVDQAVDEYVQSSASQLTTSAEAKRSQEGVRSDIVDSGKPAAAAAPAPAPLRRRFKIKNIDRYGELRGAILKPSVSELEGLAVEESEQLNVTVKEGTWKMAEIANAMRTKAKEFVKTVIENAIKRLSATSILAMQIAKRAVTDAYKEETNEHALRTTATQLVHSVFTTIREGRSRSTCDHCAACERKRSYCDCHVSMRSANTERTSLHWLAIPEPGSDDESNCSLIQPDNEEVVLRVTENESTDVIADSYAATSRKKPRCSVVEENAYGLSAFALTGSDNNVRSQKQLHEVASSGTANESISATAVALVNRILDQLDSTHSFTLKLSQHDDFVVDSKKAEASPSNIIEPSDFSPLIPNSSVTASADFAKEHLFAISVKSSRPNELISDVHEPTKRNSFRNVIHPDLSKVSGLDVRSQKSLIASIQSRSVCRLPSTNEEPRKRQNISATPSIEEIIEKADQVDARKQTAVCASVPVLDGPLLELQSGPVPHTPASLPHLPRKDSSTQPQAKSDSLIKRSLQSIRSRASQRFRVSSAHKKAHKEKAGSQSVSSSTTEIQGTMNRESSQCKDTEPIQSGENAAAETVQAGLQKVAAKLSDLGKQAHSEKQLKSTSTENTQFSHSDFPVLGRSKTPSSTDSTELELTSSEVKTDKGDGIVEMSDRSKSLKWVTSVSNSNTIDGYNKSIHSLTTDVKRQNSRISGTLTRYSSTNVALHQNTDITDTAQPSPEVGATAQPSPKASTTSQTTKRVSATSLSSRKVSATAQLSPKVSSIAQPIPKVSATTQPSPKLSATAQPSPKVSATSQPSPKASTISQPSRRISATSLPSRKVSATAQPSLKVSATAQPSPKVSATAQPSPKASTISQPSRRISATSLPSRKVSATAQPSLKVSATAQPSPKVSATAQPSPKTSATSLPSRKVSATAQSSPNASGTAQPSSKLSATAQPIPKLSATAQPCPKVSATVQPSPKASIISHTGRRISANSLLSRKVSATAQPSRKVSATAQPSTEVSATAQSSPNASVTAQTSPKLSATAQPSPKVSATAQPNRKVNATAQPSPKVSATAQPSPKVSATTQPSPKVSATAQPSPKASTISQPSRRISATSLPSRKVSATAQPSLKVSATAQPSPKVSATAQLSPKVSATAQPSPKVSATTQPSPKASVTAQPNIKSSATAQPSPRVSFTVPSSDKDVSQSVDSSLPPRLSNPSLIQILSHKISDALSTAAMDPASFNPNIKQQVKKSKSNVTSSGSKIYRLVSKHKISTTDASSGNNNNVKPSRKNSNAASVHNVPHTKDSNQFSSTSIKSIHTSSKTSKTVQAKD